MNFAPCCVVALLACCLSSAAPDLVIRVKPSQATDANGASRSTWLSEVFPEDATAENTIDSWLGLLDQSEDKRARAEQERRATYRQTISGNSSTDTVTIEFQWADGTVVTQLTDFRMQSQLLRVLIPGDEELGQPKFQALCFVSSYPEDLIPPEAVMKLRQKNPSTIRMADEEKADVMQHSPLVLNPSPLRLAAISSHLATFCKDARESIYTSEHELFTILDSSHPKSLRGSPNLANMLTSISHVAMKDADTFNRCFAVEEPSKPCLCSLRICIDWYPCHLKYCRNRDGDGEHRCGIKTCRKCTTFRFPMKAKTLCLWDEA